MEKWEIAVENHGKGYNCVQSVICAFADELGYSEDVLFGISEAFGGGMGGSRSICGVVSAMVMAAGAVKSFGLEKLPETNKKESYTLARELMDKFEKEVGSIMCCDIKGNKLRTCDECIEIATKILDQIL